MKDSLVVDIVRALEGQGIPRYAYHLQDYVDVESLERVIETAPDDAEIHLTIEGIPVVIAPDGVRIRGEEEEQHSSRKETNWLEHKSSSSPRSNIYEWTIDFLMDRLPADSVIIAEANDSHLVPVATNNEPDGNATSVEPIAASIPGHVYEKGKSCNIPDLQDVRGATAKRQDPVAPQPRSFIAAPITDIGVITAASSDPSVFTDADEATLRAVANLIAALLQEVPLSSGPDSAELLDGITDILSHDLANNVTTAKGFLELAMQTQDLDYVQKAKDSVGGIESMANMLVTLGRTGDPIEEFIEIDLREHAEDVFHSMNGGELEIRASGIILADSACLKRILQNIFQNAVDHASEEVTVEIGLLEDGFYVEDDGPGFPEEVIDNALDPGVSSQGDHHGMGLTIVNRLAQAHGWTVTISNLESGGARIEFTDVLITKSD